MDNAASEASTLNLDELECLLNRQINHEREQHAATKQLLKIEREKVHNLEQELDDSKRLASALAAGNLMNSKLLQAAMDRIEPNVKEILKTVVSSNAAQGSSHESAPTTGSNSQKLLADIAHRPTPSLPDLQEAALQLSVLNSTDQRPPILYDVLKGEMVDDVEMVPDFRSDVQNNFKQESVHPNDLRQADEAGDRQQSSPQLRVALTSVPRIEEVDEGCGGSKSENRAQGMDEFHSLDEAFENDFFPKPVRDLGTSRRAPKKEGSDDTLIDIGLEEGGLTKPSTVNSIHSQNGISKPGELLTHGENDDKLTVGPVVVQKESTIEHPIKGVEAVS